MLYETLSDSIQGDFNSGLAPQKSKPISKHINLSHLTEYMDNDKARIKKHLTRFEKQIPVSLKSLISFIDNSDFENARIVAHSMKPLLSVMGVEEGRILAEKIEQICIKNEHKGDLDATLKKLQLICNESMNELVNINL